MQILTLLNHSFIFAFGLCYSFYLLFGALQAGAFLTIYKKLTKSGSNNLNPDIDLSLCYFAGFSLTLLLLIIFSIFHISFSCSVTIIAATYLLIIILGKTYRDLILRISHKDLCLFFLLIVFFSIQNLCNWTFDGASYDMHASPHSSFGSMESGRYSNIANFIIRSDFIPVLGQNYLHSIYAAFNQSNSSLFNLYALLSLNQAIFFICLLKNSQRLFKLDAGFSWLVTLFIYFGSWSISKSHIFLIDSGAPLFITGYSDTIISLGSFLAFYVIANSGIQLTKKSLLIFVISFGWAFCAPQNILFGMTYLSLVALVKFVRTAKIEWQPLTASSVAIAFASMFGGMISPLFRRTIDHNIMGILETSEKVSPKIKPSFDYLVFHSAETGFGFTHISINFFSNGLNGSIDLIRILFIPLLGIGLWLFFRNRKELSKELKSHELGICTFILTLLFILLVSFGENKWAVSRFILPGLMINILVLAKIAEHHFKNIKTSSFRMILVLAALIFFIPTSSTIYYRWSYYFNSGMIQSVSKLLTLTNDIGS